MLAGFEEPVPESFVEDKRQELGAMLRLAEDAARLPWSVLGTIHAERRFQSSSRCMPPAEAKALRARFEQEMARLYAIEDSLAQDAAS